MKKFFAILMSIIVASAALVSCGNDKGSSSDSSSSSSVSDTSTESSGTESSDTTSSEGSSETASGEVTAAAIYDAINEAFAEKYPDAGMVIPNMPMEVDETTLKDKFGITTDMVTDYKGEIAGMMTNCDMLLIVKAADGKLEDVKAALEKAKDDQTAQFEMYGVMGNIERTQAAKVVTNGDYAALIMVGIMPEDETATVDFTEDVQLAEDTFNATIDAGK